MNRRRLEALRNLAERPGTEAEGKLAREILAREGAKPKDPHASSANYYHHPAFARMDAAKCAEIDTEKRARFPRGTRVYYNCWAYDENCAGRVTGYPRKPSLWGWINVKFDHLKNSRSIPIYGEHGWHLSTEPLRREDARPLRGGMHRFDGTGDVIADAARA